MYGFYFNKDLMNKFISYTSLVLKLLKNNQYCQLRDCVLITISYKEMIPNDEESKTFHDNILFENDNEPFKYVYFKKGMQYIEMFKSNDIDIKNLEIKNISLVLRQNFINQVLKTNFKYFEEEIYTFIAHLNFSPHKICSIIGIKYEDSTRFIPMNFKMWVRHYTIKHLERQSATSSVYFGLSKQYTVIEPRIIDGKISKATSDKTILSLHDAKAFVQNTTLPEYVRGYLPYTIYYANEAYIILAFNPLENPIINL